MRRIRIPKFGYNWITATGSIISFVIILLMTFLYVIDIFASHTNPYVGIFLYMALPPILIFGLIQSMAISRHIRTFQAFLAVAQRKS